MNRNYVVVVKGESGPYLLGTGSTKASALDIAAGINAVGTESAEAIVDVLHRDVVIERQRNRTPRTENYSVYYPGEGDIMGRVGFADLPRDRAEAIAAQLGGLVAKED